MLIDFCIHDMFLANTAFEHAAHHKTTWTGWRRDQQSGHTVPVFNQIDYILCRQSQKCILTDSRSYGGAETGCDHRILVARLLLSRVYGILYCKAPTNQRQAASYNTSKLAASPTTRAQYFIGVSISYI
eukprot:scpid60442/ scgid25796/ Craniofacial development protein 2; p97 bucentaur protein